QSLRTGIERIDDDGTIVITDKSHTIMRNILGYDVKSFRVEDSKLMAIDLGKAFRRYGELVGLPDFALNAIYMG
ncbi:unnamed protein product, partial [marine sediment metagenome]